MLDFPLDAAFFPQLVLTEQEVSHYHTLGKQRLHALTTLLESDSAALEWSATATEHVQCAQLHRVRQTDKRIDIYTWLKSSVVVEGASVEDALGAIAKVHSASYRKTMRALHGNALVDACVLFNFGERNDSQQQQSQQMPPPASASHAQAQAQVHPASAAHRSRRPRQQLGREELRSDIEVDAAQPEPDPSPRGDPPRTIKWLALDGGAAQDPRIVDFVFLEYAGRRRRSASSSTANSKVVAFCVQESVQLARQVPTLETFGIQRRSLSHCGVLISQDDSSDDALRITSLCRLDADTETQAAPSTAMETIMEHWVGAIQGVRLLIGRQREDSETVPPAWLETLVTRQQRGCRLCGRRFLLHRRHHCRVCDQVVCSTCAPKRWLAVMSAISMRVRVCWRCMLHHSTSDGTGNGTPAELLVPPIASSRMGLPVSTSMPSVLPGDPRLSLGGVQSGLPSRFTFDRHATMPPLESEMLLGTSIPPATATARAARAAPTSAMAMAMATAPRTSRKTQTGSTSLFQQEVQAQSDLQLLHARLEQARQQVHSLQHSLHGRDSRIVEMESMITRLQHGLTISDDESLRHRRLMAALTSENALLGARYQKQTGRLRGMEAELKGLRTSVRSLKDLVATSTEEIRRLANERAALERHVSDQAEELSSLRSTRSNSTAQG